MTTAGRVHFCMAELNRLRIQGLDDEEQEPKVVNLVDAINDSFAGGDVYRNVNTREALPSSAAVILALLDKTPLEIEPTFPALG